MDGRRDVAKFKSPFGICYDDISQSLIVCDFRNNRLRRVHMNGISLTHPLSNC